MNNIDFTNQSLKQTTVNLGLLLLLIFAFIRPLSLVFEDFAGLPVQKIFPIIISYFLLIAVLLNISIRRIKFDLISVLIFMFCAYCSLSILWGTQIVWLARFVLPFTVFFAIRLYVKGTREINILLITLAAGFILPIIGSTFLIFKGASVGSIQYYSGLTRYQGMFSSMHPFAHAMTFFSFLTAFLFQQINIKSKLFKYGLVFLLLLSIFCLYKSNVRNTYLGFIIFWFVFLVCANKKYAFVFIIGILFVVILNSENVKNIFWQNKAHYLERSVDSASSGRITIWKHNLDIFSKLSIERKLLGLGIGAESGAIGGVNKDVWASHNDYLSLLMTLGILGLIVYLLILIVLLKDIYMSGVEKQTKYLIIAILMSVGAMNFLSNAYVTRVEMSQLLWFLMGIFYRLNDLNDEKESNV